MRRRNVIIGAAASGIGGITLLGSGAFDTATAERTATVNFADDEDSYLGLIAESEYAIDDDGELALDFTGAGTDGDGIGRNSEYFFDLVFSIANQATNPVSITITTDTESFDGEFTLYPTGDRDEKLNDGSNAIELPVGESQSIGTHVQTGDVDVTNDVDIDVEVAAEFDDEGDEDPPEEPDPDPFDELQFRSGASQIASDGESQLTDQSVIAAWAPLGSENIDQSDSDPVEYSSDDEIPIVSVDETVAGLGTPELIEDEEADFSVGNEQFVLNLLDEVAGSGTILWDEGHDGFWTITDDEDNSFDDFVDYAESNGYSFEATTDVAGDLDDADGIVIGSPTESYTSDELDALDSFVDNGGGVLLFDESDFTLFGDFPDGLDETENLNEIADALDLEFRFNSDQVEDSDGNFDFVTSEFNLDEFGGLFEDREGI